MGGWLGGWVGRARFVSGGVTSRLFLGAVSSFLR